ncbi:glutamate synthase subunit beta [Liquorilactobacillus ghanensis DSM 18630]|uniref:Glutamate synthase subunit beta n=1 Tax=Liquorilactobacillus ghanensis DSM 18630 TaxID=1423750 RepID=A0A0R1VKF7_9LACO|nr:glutamate synthase subunit beta [Liquorilactobacillus ghanensis]KRM05765.1 glutamate synthase subunit beta [Liquorilactobacillus ghanensis DSM 18630]
MADPFGFMKYPRETNPYRDVKERIKDFAEMQLPLSDEERRKQAARCMNCGVPHCHAGFFYAGGKAVSGCPNDNLIPEWNDLVYRQEDKRAFERLTKTNPLPEFTGRVCPAPCEVACNEALNGQGITIKDNERFIIEQGFKFDWVIDSGMPQHRNGIKIAVIGSGPAGLSAAWQLNKFGFDVTVYERDDRPGGLTMYGIPNMKLPKEIVSRRIAAMEAVGIKFIVNTEVGVDITAAELKAQYQRIILTVGARSARDLAVPGRELKGVMQAVDFLTQATKEVLQNGTKATKLLAGKKVVVIGGGDTGNDCIATAVRQGAAEIHQLEITRQPPKQRLASNPWPQWPMVAKTGYGQQEAQTLFGDKLTAYETTAVGFSGKDGRVTQMTTSKARLFKPVAGTEQDQPVDLVLLAMGFTGPQKSVMDAFGITQINDDYSTNEESVFVAGDARRGPSLVIWGIHEGRMVADQVAHSCEVRL